MFWGCFSYDKKGPCHIWKAETKAEKQAADIHLKELNRHIEPTAKAEWELNNRMNRLGLRNRPGRKPVWKFTAKTGKVTRREGKGVDWYRYQQQIIIPKLIPFAKECKVNRPNTVVQEDGAPCHSHHAQAAVYNIHEIERLLWCGNSPDLNMIEPCWSHMKRVTTRKGAPKTRKEAEQVWKNTWKDLEQWRIQAWIQRIKRHVDEIIDNDGDNSYREGLGIRPRRFITP